MNTFKFSFNITEIEYGVGVETDSYNAYLGIKRRQELEPETTKHINKKIKPFQRKKVSKK